MVYQVIVGLVAVGVGAVALPRLLKPELSKILQGLENTVTKLQTFEANKAAEISDHLEEIALHNAHVQLKSADKERATRIRDKLNVLLA